MSSFVVRDVNSDTVLEFSTLERFESSEGLVTFNVALRGSEVQCATRLEDFDAGSWVELFSEMERNWRGWPGEKFHATYGGNFSIVATSDNLGHISLKVSIAAHAGLRWSMVAEISTEAGQLPMHAQNAADFCAGLETDYDYVEDGPSLFERPA